MRNAWVFVIAICLCGTELLHAGVHYSAETYSNLPSQWRGFLLDQRALRNIAIQPRAGDVAPIRQKYLLEAEKLREKAQKTELSAEENADLGAIYLRLNEPQKAVDVLRAASRRFPHHFAIQSNLGTAWQLTGDLQQAEIALRNAVRLAPGRFLPAEELHLKLVQVRQKRKGQIDLDALLGVRFVGETGDFAIGLLADAERKKLPSRAVGLVQQLALWLPNDGLLVWQLAELANAHGDVRTAAAMLEGCVVQFGITHPEVRRRRQLLREAVDKLPANTAKTDHESGHLQFRSRRPLLSQLESAPLPPISDSGANALPWELLGETTVEKPFRPQFAKYLRELEGKLVTVTGFMQPLRDDPELAAFMFVEYPIGCWFCEMPDTTSIVYVEMARDESARFERTLRRVTGRLSLNNDDPENFLYTVKDAKIVAFD